MLFLVFRHIIEIRILAGALSSLNLPRKKQVSFLSRLTKSANKPLSGMLTETTAVVKTRPTIGSLRNHDDGGTEHYKMSQICVINNEEQKVQLHVLHKCFFCAFRSHFFPIQGLKRPVLQLCRPHLFLTIFSSKPKLSY